MNGLDADRLCASVLALTETAQDIALELETILYKEGDAVHQKKQKEEDFSETDIFLKV